jgi:hypothetical protein
MKTEIKSLNEMANTGNKWAVIAFDETYNWSEEILNRGVNKIEGVYLINLKMPTHLCSLDVAYPAIFLSNFFDNREQFDDDEITELERENGGENVTYYSGSSTPKIISTINPAKKNMYLIMKCVTHPTHS